MSYFLSAVLTEADLPLGELWAACLDGELFPFSTAFRVPDLPETKEMRALALAPLLSSHTLVEKHSAAWVLGARDDPPVQHTLAVRYSERAAESRRGTVHVREVVLRAGDTMRVAGIEVTTPLRTAVDLVRSQDFDEERERPVVARLLNDVGLGLPDCRAYLDAARKLPHKRIALTRLTDALLDAALSPADNR